MNTFLKQKYNINIDIFLHIKKSYFLSEKIKK